MRWLRSFELANTAGKCGVLAVMFAAAALSAPEASPPGELRDIAGPVEMPEDPVWPYCAACTVLAAGAVSAWLWLLRRRRAADLAAETAAALRPGPPHEVALEAMRVLGTAAPKTREEHHAFYVRLVEILRAYIAGRFGVNEPDATAQELLATLFRTGEIAPERQKALRALVAEADLVKFAASVPAPDAPMRVLEVCRAFVRETAMEAVHAI